MLTTIEAWFSVFMLFCASQAVTGLYLLLKEKKRPFANNMLALLFISWGFSCYWFFAFIQKEPFFSRAVTTFIGPMISLTLFPPIFLYIRYLFRDYTSFRKIDYLHFLPVFLFIGFTLYLFWAGAFTIAGMRSHPWYHARTMVCSYVTMIQGPCYFYATNRILKLWRGKLKQEYSDIERRKLQWLKVINFSFALIFIIGGISTIIRTTHFNPYYLYIGYHTVMGFSLFYITLKIYTLPELFTRPDKTLPISYAYEKVPHFMAGPLTDSQQGNSNGQIKDDKQWFENTKFGDNRVGGNRPAEVDCNRPADSQVGSLSDKQLNDQHLNNQQLPDNQINGDRLNDELVSNQKERVSLQMDDNNQLIYTEAFDSNREKERNTEFTDALKNESNSQKDHEIIEKLQHVMQVQKLYRDPNISLHDLAFAISESRNTVSTVLNNRLHKTFYDYINELRVEECKLLLSDPGKLNFTIEAIAAEAGFKTMSVFYRLFKDIVNTTPAQFRKQTGGTPKVSDN